MSNNYNSHLTTIRILGIAIGCILWGIFEKRMAQDGDKPTGTEVIQANADGIDKGCSRSQIGGWIKKTAR